MASVTPKGPGLMKAVAQRIETEIFGACDENMRKTRGCVLVCDEAALSVLECSFKMNDLTRMGMPIVESLSKACGVANGRQSLPQNPVIYFCKGTQNNIARIAEDWKEGSSEIIKDWKIRPYLEAHIFFVSQPSKVLVNQLVASKVLLKHLKNLKSVNMDFLAVEPNLFTLQMPQDLGMFFGTQRSVTQQAAAIDQVASQILDVVRTMGDTVTVRHQKGGKCSVAYQVAKRIVDTQVERCGVKQGPATLLVLDRSIDPGAPLLHELTYQAMLLDMLPDTSSVQTAPATVPSKAKVTIFGGEKTRATVVDEQDELWCRMRHQHIADNAKMLAKEMNAHVSSSKAIAMRREAASGQQVSTSQLADALKEAPMIKEKLRMYDVHNKLHEALIKTDLDRICDIEQDLACRETKEGCKLDASEIKKKCEAFLESARPTYEEKLRIMLLYIISQGALSKDTQARWLNYLGSAVSRLGGSAWEKGDGIGKMIENLAQLDVVTEKKKWFQSKPRQHQPTVDQDAYDWSRYVPNIKVIAEHLVDGRLAEVECPHTVKEETPQSAVASSSSAGGGRSQRPAAPREGYTRTWGTSLRGENDGIGGGATSIDASGPATYPDALPWSLKKVKPGSRVYIFVVGGATYSETRSIAQTIASKEVEIVLGATSLLTPGSFLTNLSNL